MGIFQDYASWIHSPTLILGVNYLHCVKILAPKGLSIQGLFSKENSLLAEVSHVETKRPLQAGNKENSTINITFMG